MFQRSLFAEPAHSFVAEEIPPRQPNERIGLAAVQFLTPEHLDMAKDWPDWHECLIWAWETEATSAEMAAWRRAFKVEANQPTTKPTGKSKKL